MLQGKEERILFKVTELSRINVKEKYLKVFLCKSS